MLDKSYILALFHSHALQGSQDIHPGGGESINNRVASQLTQLSHMSTPAQEGKGQRDLLTHTSFPVSLSPVLMKTKRFLENCSLTGHKLSWKLFPWVDGLHHKAEDLSLCSHYSSFSWGHLETSREQVGKPPSTILGAAS